MSQTAANTITFRCECGAKLGLRRSAAGHRAQCPKCKAWFTVPTSEDRGTATPPPVPPTPRSQSASARTPTPQRASRPQSVVTVRRSTTNPDLAKIQCRCGKKFGVPIAASGRKARCPGCRQVLLVPDIEPLLSPPPEEEEAGLPFAEEDTGDDERVELFAGQSGAGSLFAELGEGDEIAQASGAAPAPAFISCPNCARPMPAAARTCDACCYDIKKGRIPGVKKQKAAQDGEGIRARIAESGVLSLVLGTVFSGLGAVVGAVIWCLIAMLTEREFAIIAWGIGLLSGFGMYVAGRRESTIGGIIASIMAAIGIIVGKIMVVLVILVGVIRDAGEGLAADLADEPGIVDDSGAEGESDVEFDFATEALVGRLAFHNTQLRAQEMGLRRDDDQRDRIDEEETARLRDMPKEKLQSLADELDAWEKGGKWEDPDYVRNHLIYAYADKAIDAKRDAGEIEQYRFPTEQEWRVAYDDAVERVDAMSPDVRVATAKEMEAEAQREMEEQMAEFAGEMAGAAAGFLLFALFGWFDLIIFPLAVLSAYKIAGGAFGGH